MAHGGFTGTIAGASGHRRLRIWGKWVCRGNGAFEAAYADLAGLAATIGDRADDRAISTGAPVGRVRSERSDNFDLGFQFGSRRARFELTAFRIDLQDAIVSQTLILPAGAVGQFLGDQMVTRQLASGSVFVPLSSAPDIEGGTPPLTINLRLRFSPGGKRYWAEGYSTLADRRTGATRSRANIATFFANGAVGQGLVVNGILVPAGENLAQVQNRVLGAANSAPMFTAVPGYGLFGARAGWRTTERSDVFIDCSNVFDQRHRGVSWGVDGAGRAVTVRYLLRF